MNQHPFIFSNKFKYRFQRHFAFWFVWWLSQGLLYSFVAINNATDFYFRLPSALVESLVYLTVHMFLAYTLMYFILPRFLLKQKYLLTAVSVILLFFITAAMSAVLSVTVIESVRTYIMGDFYISQKRAVSVNIFLSLMAGLRGGITIGGVATTIKLMKYWYMKEQRNLQLQKENIAAQLQLLKAQVHPHFLFNTLNNIYSYTQNTSAIASTLVMGLSDMLRYILYEGSKPLVPLQAELKMLQDYITLEMIRYDDHLDVSLDLPKQTKGIYIAPLLLLPFVENCFKHGAGNMLEQPWVSLTIALHDNELVMKLINGKPNIPIEKQPKPGIGISNVKKRLELLYPNKHELIITNEEDVFVVDLTLQLETSGSSSNVSQSLTVPKNA